MDLVETERPLRPARRPARPVRGGRQDRGRGPRPHRLRRAQGRARGRASDGYYRVERAFGAFSRSLTLPEGVDAEAVTASFDRGVLEVRIPKPEQRKPRKIAIGGGDEPETPSRRRGRAARVARDAGGGRAASARPPPCPVRRSAPATRARYARTGTLHARPRRGRARRRSSRSRPRPSSRRSRSARPPSSASTWCSGTRSTCSSTPGHELIARARRAARVHALGPADHHRLRRLPGLLDGPRHGRRRDQGPRRAVRRRARRRDPRDRGGGRDASAPTSTARRSSWARRPRWRSRPRSARTSRSCSTSARRSTSTATTPRARPSARTAGSTAASPGTREHGPDGQVVYGIVQGGVDEDLRARVGAGGRRARRRRDRDRRLARRGQGRRCSRSSSWAIDGAAARTSPRHLLGIGESTTSCAASSSASTPSTARCRRGSAATAWRVVPDPDDALARRPRQGAAGARPTSRCSRAARARPARTATRRAYLHYLLKAARADRACGCSRSTTSPTCSG